MPDLTGTLQTHLPELGLGALLGFACGYALRRAALLVLLLLGGLFLALQLLVYMGFVAVDWGRVQQALNPLLHEETRNLWAQGMQVLASRLPFGSSFTLALLLGWRFR